MTIVNKISEPELTKYKPIVAVGIDLGTTNSVIARKSGGVVCIFPDAERNEVIPSVVYYGPDLTIVGHKAKAYKDAIYSIKRDMDYGDEAAIRISSDILKALKAQAEEILGRNITHTVITVPARFGEAGRKATKLAAELAGLEVLRILNEPTAAALAYGLNKKEAISNTYLVFDMGGGTCDISIVRFYENLFRVIATIGDLNLGGDDIDRAIAMYISNRHNVVIDISTARQVKEHLTNHTIWNKQINGHDIKFNIDDLKTVLAPFFARIDELFTAIFADLPIDKKDIDEVLLIGGSTFMPLLRNYIEQYFKKEPLTSIDPERAVAIGAATQAAILTGDEAGVALLDINPLPIAIELHGNDVEVIIPKNAPIPIEITNVYTTAVDNQAGMLINILQLYDDKGGLRSRNIGKFLLKNLAMVQSGVARVEVKFRLDADSILTVEAMDVNTKAFESVEIHI